MKKVGFTLIELIITVSIIALITGIFLANYYGGESQSQLLNATSALMRDLRLAQTKGAANVSYGSDVPGSWGISLTTASSSYVLFADLNNNHIYNGATESITLKGGKTISLPEGVVISSIKLEGASSSYNKVYITFYYDNGVLKTYLNNNNLQFMLPVEVTLEDANTGATKTVTINAVGLISSNL